MPWRAICPITKWKENLMKAIVVYESHWGNTAAIARAIAEGLGPEARALSTTEATGEAVAGADLIVAGAPLLGFSLPTESMLKGLASNAGRDPTPPDLSHPSMRSWIDALPAGNAREPRSRRGSGGRPAALRRRSWPSWKPRAIVRPPKLSVLSCRASTARSAKVSWKRPRPGVQSSPRRRSDRPTLSSIVLRLTRSPSSRDRWGTHCRPHAAAAADGRGGKGNSE